MKHNILYRSSTSTKNSVDVSLVVLDISLEINMIFSVYLLPEFGLVPSVCIPFSIF